jgi:RNA polymerase-binding transcription factor DksA
VSLQNRDYDLADMRAEEERAVGILRAQEAVRRQGEIFCKGCKSEIDPERRAALPSADRCIDCAKRRERSKRRRS